MLDIIDRVNEVVKKASKQFPLKAKKRFAQDGISAIIRNSVNLMSVIKYDVSKFDRPARFNFDNGWMPLAIGWRCNQVVAEEL